MIWRKVAIGEFLDERKDRFKPEEANSMNLKRINKIDFSGNIHLEKNKPTKTGMILIKSGDLVISGINADKGAVSIYTGKEDVMATIHYSSYSYDSKKINIDYLKWYLKSKPFLNILKEQTKGGIKTELKAKKILPLVIDIPNLEGQKLILDKINSINEECNELAKLQTETIDNISQLKQSILQEAIQGKLTADWRAQNPKTEPASELLKRIKAEKAQLIKDKKIKKEKPLPPITEDEIPFELPDGWVWCRLGDVSNVGTGATPLTSNNSYYENGEIPWVTSSATGNLFVEEPENFITAKALVETNCNLNPIGTLVIAMYGQGKTRGQITELKFEAATNQACATINPYLTNIELRRYVKIYFRKIYLEIRELAQGGAQPNLNMGKIKNTVIPLPPIKEQKAIVEKVEILMQKCQVLEQEIKTSEAHAQMLMQAVLKEAFEGKKEVVC
ncbi:MAG: restriction endonuclease subunit S [Balneolales bacterium]|nr:restriction endonuclease subunit S [Balneolales bacterium]